LQAKTQAWQGGYFITISPATEPIKERKIKLTTKSQIEFRSAVLADSSTTVDCYSVNQPCGKPFVVRLCF